MKPLLDKCETLYVLPNSPAKAYAEKRFPHKTVKIVDGAYSVLDACLVDGPDVEIERNDAAYTHWDCHEGGDGLWHLWLTS